MKKNLLLALFFVFFFYGCGGGGGVSTDNVNVIQKSYFYDSSVDGVEYTCGNNVSGVTGDSGGSGSFRYKGDCTVQFKIGKINLGSVDGSLLSNETKIYPTTILGLKDGEVDERVENILVFLQTLDSDKNVSNGITIDENVTNILNLPEIDNADFVLNFNTNEANISKIFEVLNEKDETKVYTLVSKEEALLHFQETLKKEENIIVNLSNPKPYLVDKTGKETSLTQIKTANTLFKDIIIKGKANTKIFRAFNTTGIYPIDSQYVDTNKTIGSDRNGYLRLNFNNDTITNFHYFIKLIDSDNNASEPLHINVIKDTIPPYILNANIFEAIEEEQKLFKDIQASDNSGIVKSYRIISFEEDNKSINADMFDINPTNGIITFKTEPNFDDNINAIFKVVARAIDTVGNMTDLLMNVFLKNILDNPPVIDNTKSKENSILEGLASGVEVFNLSSLLETNLTKAPDNNLSLSPIYYNLHNHTDIFEINRNTGIITIKDATNPLFDFEQLPNTIDLNVSIENNNTKYKDTNNLTQNCNTCNNKTYAMVNINILNKIDTIPQLLVPSPITIFEKSSNYLETYPIGGILKNLDLSDKNTTMSFSISNGNTGSNFSIDSLNGVISIKPNPSFDYETIKQYILTIRATNTWWDGTQHYSEVNQTINITNVVDIAPKILLNTLISSPIPENTSSGTTLATFKKDGLSSDENLTTSFSIIEVKKNNILQSAGSHPFMIDSSNGTVSTSRQLLNDYIETTSNTDITNFKLKVQSHNIFWDNSTGDSNIVSFDVNISNTIDNLPVLPSLPTLSIAENTSTPTILYDVNTSGVNYDENSVTSFSIISGNGESKFTIDSSGVIRLVNPLDWEVTKTYTLGIQASNSYGNSIIKYLTINVVNIIESPPTIVAPSLLSVHENVDIGEILDFIKIDSLEEDKKHVNTITIASGNNDGKFSISSLKENELKGFKYVDFKTSAKLDFETVSSYAINISATNNSGTSNHTINVNVLDDVEKDLPLLITMIEYNDINITTSTSDVYNKVFSTTPPLFGSLNDYFYRVSKNKFLFKQVSDSNGTNDGIVKIKLPKKHPQTDINELKTDISSALSSIGSYVDFASFDLDNDGSIAKDELQLLFIIAGGEITYGDSNLSIKATSGTLASPVTLDGKNVASTGGGNYVVVGEKNGNNRASIGLIAHHLGNTALNFPYLNDRTNASYGIGFIGLMGYGYMGKVDVIKGIGTTPVNPSAYNIISQGWVYPRVIDQNTTNIELVPSNKGIAGFNILKISTLDSKIYYLLENRIKTDLVGYDDGFFGMENTTFNGGLSLWKINTNYSDNDNVSTKLVDFIEYDKDTGIDTKGHFGKSSSLFKTGNSSYPSDLNLPFSISNATLKNDGSNTMIIDITFP